MIAALAMYDAPHLRGPNDRFWQEIKGALGWGPEGLTRDADPWEIWQSPDLVLAQTCGLPLRARLSDQVTLVGTPDYGVTGCPPGYYRSLIIVREGWRPREPLSVAYNEALSQSGWAALCGWAEGAGFTFGQRRVTGGHALSMAAVAEGRADLAAVDAVTWSMLAGSRPAGLEVLTETAPTPGLPLITKAGGDARALADAVQSAITGLAASDRAALQLKGLVEIPLSDYLCLALPPRP